MVKTIRKKKISAVTGVQVCCFLKSFLDLSVCMHLWVNIKRTWRIGTVKKLRKYLLFVCF